MPFFDQKRMEVALENLHREYRDSIIIVEQSVDPKNPTLPLLKGREYKELQAVYQNFRGRVLETVWEALNLVMEDSSFTWEKAEAKLPSRVFRMGGTEFSAVIQVNYKIEICCLTSETAGERNIFVRIICLRAKWPPFPSMPLHVLLSAKGKFLPSKALEIFSWRTRNEIQTAICSAYKKLTEKWGE